jgi:hypothetical protein
MFKIYKTLDNISDNSIESIWLGYPRLDGYFIKINGVQFDYTVLRKSVCRCGHIMLNHQYTGHCRDCDQKCNWPSLDVNKLYNEDTRYRVSTSSEPDWDL